MKKPAVHWRGSESNWSWREQVMTTDDVINLRIDLAVLSTSRFWKQYFTVADEAEFERRRTRTGKKSNGGS